MGINAYFQKLPLLNPPLEKGEEEKENKNNLRGKPRGLYSVGEELNF